MHLSLSQRCRAKLVCPACNSQDARSCWELFRSVSPILLFLGNVEPPESWLCLCGHGFHVFFSDNKIEILSSAWNSPSSQGSWAAAWDRPSKSSERFQRPGTWRSWDGIWSDLLDQLSGGSCQDACGIPKSNLSSNKAAKHAWFFRFDWAYTVLMPGNGAVKWLQTQRIKLAWKLRDSMSQRKIQTSTTCVMLYECIIYRLLYRCFLQCFAI